VGGARLDPGDAPGGVDVDRREPPEVDQHSTVAQGGAEPVVATGLDRHALPRGCRLADESRDVVRVPGSGDDVGSARRDDLVPHGAATTRFIARITAADSHRH